MPGLALHDRHSTHFRPKEGEQGEHLAQQLGLIAFYLFPLAILGGGTSAPEGEQADSAGPPTIQNGISGWLPLGTLTTYPLPASTRDSHGASWAVVQFT